MGPSGASEDKGLTLFDGYCMSLLYHREGDGGWEMNTMAAFLFEELPSDALSFFLTARYLVFEGPEVKELADLQIPDRRVPIDRLQKVMVLLFGQASHEERGAFTELISRATMRQDSETAKKEDKPANTA